MTRKDYETVCKVLKTSYQTNKAMWHPEEQAYGAVMHLHECTVDGICKAFNLTGTARDTFRKASGVWVPRS